VIHFVSGDILLSRAQVYVLESLKAEDLDVLIARGFEAEGIDSTADARARIAEFADGDGRRGLNPGEQGTEGGRVEGGRGAHGCHKEEQVGVRLDVHPELGEAPIGGRAIQHLGQDEYREDDGGLVGVAHADPIRTSGARRHVAKPARNRA